MKAVFLICTWMVVWMRAEAQTAATYVLKGNELYNQSQFDQAEIQYRMALETDPKNVTAKYNLANALQKQKKYNEALTILEELSASATDKNLRSTTYYNQGVAHTKLKNLESSIESYKNALRINPDDKQARENLQKALRELKKKQDQQNQQKKSDPKMSQKEAEQKLKQLQQKEKELHQRMQNKKDGTGSQTEDW